VLSHKGTETINTDRLLLRRFELDDANQMFINWANDSEVTKFLTWEPHASLEVTKQTIEMWVSKYKDTKTYEWAIELKEIKEVIGSIAIVELDEENDACEIGYCISRKYWGKGIMSESLNAVIDYLFSEIGFNRICAKYDTNNVASGKVMEKSGMKYEGTLRQVKIRNHNEFYDLALYAILKNEWLMNNKFS
jgi:[ribosomal protein S5]-alanine N-acetyltransferase